jgi:hypothetical protein
MAEMFFQIYNLIDRRKENKCKNKTTNKQEGNLLTLRISNYKIAYKQVNKL